MSVFQITFIVLEDIIWRRHGNERT